MTNATSEVASIHKAATYRQPSTKPSRGGLDAIDPDDVIYGEYASGAKGDGVWVDLVYLDGDVLRTFSGAVEPRHPVMEELKILLRNDKQFYVVTIKEVPLGFAFKHLDITDIRVTSVISANQRHGASCVWSIRFKNGVSRTLEADYQAYFAYASATRPKGDTNSTVLDKVFPVT